MTNCSSGIRLTLLALLTSCLLATPIFAAPPTTVHLNEFVASNVSGILDEDGQEADWIELVNGSAVAVDLAGWSLTDDAAEADKWVFPAVTVSPGQFLIVFASGKDRRPASGLNFHTNFKLNASGGYLGLFNLPAGAAAVSQIFRLTLNSGTYFTLESLRDVITEVVACFPVYRTYVDEQGWTAEDRASSSRPSRAHGGGIRRWSRSLFDFFREVMLARDEGGASATRRSP